MQLWMQQKGWKAGRACAHAWSSLVAAYLLGLLAMIKCSICSYQCDN